MPADDSSTPRRPCKGGPRLIDISGQVFGRLTVVQYDGFRNDKSMWLCSCVCGQTVSISGTDLKLGKRVSCGCAKLEVFDLTGQKFGELTVLERAPNRGRKMYWFCECSCGTRWEVRGDILKGVTTQSCGCKRGNDLVGQTFSRLTVESEVDRSPAGNRQFFCVCSCGQFLVVSGSHLENGNTKSCGCLKSLSGRSSLKTRVITFDGLTLTVAEWSERTGIPGVTLNDRINAGWPLDRALREPVRRRGKYHEFR